LSLSLLNGFKLLKVKQLTFDLLLSQPSGAAYSASQSLWLPGWLEAINSNTNSLFLTIGPGDFLVHHAIALVTKH
jgi:photosystem I P700 chlorophyll a apoprotein A2